MKLILLILAGLSAFALGVIAGIMKTRRNGGEKNKVGKRQPTEQWQQLTSEDHRHFLSYDGSVQA